MMSFLLNVFLFLLGLGIGVKYERWVRDRVSINTGHSRFQETGFPDSRVHRASTFKHSASAKKGSSRFHIS